MVDFLLNTMNERRQWNDIFKVLKGKKTVNLEFYIYLVKISIKVKEK